MKLMYYLVITTQTTCFILDNCQICFISKVFEFIFSQCGSMADLIDLKL